MSALGRTLAVTRKEFRQLRRDRLSLGMIVGIPLLQVLLFGYAINQDVRHLPAAVADLAGTQRARALIADAQASQVVDVVATARTATGLEALLRRGLVEVGLLIPADFEQRVARGDRPAAQLLVNGSDPVVLQSVRGLLDLPVEHFAPAPPRPAPAFELRAYYNPERRSAVQIVPGLIGVILTMTMVLFTAVAIVRERERGNLELLITTPVRTIELMVGKIAPYVVIGLVQVSLILLLAAFLFEVPIRGPLPALYAGALVFIAASLTVGLVFSTAAQTQFQAMQMTFFFFLPSILLSGFMFPFEGMPRFARWIGEVIPLTHFVRIVRGIVLRGADLGDVRGELWPLALFCAVTLTVAVTRFRKRLD